MNKLTKAGIATAAGIALLMGGAGTLAYWNDTATLTGGEITAGNLEIVTPINDGTWATATAPAVAIDIDDYRVVPGETLVYTTTFDVVVEGDALQAQLTLSGGGIQPATDGKAADEALAGYFNAAGNTVIEVTGTDVVYDADDDVYSIPAGTTTLTVEVSLTFPRSSTAGAENAAREGAVDLSSLSVALRQV